MGGQLHETEDSPIIMPSQQKEERLDKIHKEMAGKFIDEEKRRLYKRRLEEMAYFLLKTNREDDAQSALAAALAFGPEGVPSDKHPFALRLIKEGLSVYYSEKKEEKKKSNLIVTPSQHFAEMKKKEGERGLMNESNPHQKVIDKII